MNWIIILGIISALAITISIIQSYLLFRMYKRIRRKPLFGGKATYFLDDCESEKNCSICLGRIGNGLVVRCSCGKISHSDCATLTEICPYCEKSFDKINPKPAKTAKCPACKATLNGSVCKCGIVYPRSDGTIACTCGNLVNVDRPLCYECGMFYGNNVATQLGESISIKVKS